jgi:hypothetical protein
MTSLANELMSHDFTGEQQMQTNRKPEQRTKETKKNKSAKTQGTTNYAATIIAKIFDCRIIVSRFVAKTIIDSKFTRSL